MSAAKYGAKIGGSRSAPPFRLVPGVTDQSYHPHKDVFAAVNDQAAVMIQIESLEGINNLDAILTEVGEHIDIVWLGALDARVSMGLPAQFGAGGEPEWLAAREKFFQVIDKHDKPYGGFSFASAPFGSPDMIRQASERMSYMVVSADVLHLLAMHKDLLDARSVASGFVKGANAKAATNDTNGTS